MTRSTCSPSPHRCLATTQRLCLPPFHCTILANTYGWPARLRWVGLTVADFNLFQWIVFEADGTRRGSRASLLVTAAGLEQRYHVQSLQHVFFCTARWLRVVGLMDWFGIGDNCHPGHLQSVDLELVPGIVLSLLGQRALTRLLVGPRA